MKSLKISLKQIRLGLALALQLPLMMNSVSASTFLGEVCWKVEDNDPELAPGEFAILKLAVSEVGSGHFTLNGTVQNFDANVLERTDVIHGNAEIVDGKIVMNLVNSFHTPDVEYGFSVMNGELDSETFNGTFRSIDTERDIVENTILPVIAEGDLVIQSTCP